MFSGPIANSAGVAYITGMIGPVYPESRAPRLAISITAQIEQLRLQILMGIASYLEYLIYGSNSYPAFRMVSAYLAGMPETS